MGLSSNILWHQTNKESFYKIIKSKSLTCSYCLESFLDNQHKMGFPMISLSDIPLADIGEYLDQYGGYSLGFSRKWVVENGFNPVWYCEKSNRATVQHKQMLLDSYKNKQENLIASNLTLLFYYGAYMKEIEGNLEVKSKNIKYNNYRFYDEREYRYIPDYNVLIQKNIPPFLNEDQYKDYKNKNGNLQIDVTLPFTFNDLKIIIVKTDKQANQLKEFLKKDDIHIFTHNEIKQSIIGIGHQIITEKIIKQH